MNTTAVNAPMLPLSYWSRSNIIDDSREIFMHCPYGPVS
jgi:hypothetical protein